MPSINLLVTPLILTKSLGEGGFGALDRKKIEHLDEWCHNTNLWLHINITKDPFIDLRKGNLEVHMPTSMVESMGKRVSSFEFLGVDIEVDLSWFQHIDAIIKKTHQCLYFIRSVKRFSVWPNTLKHTLLQNVALGMMPELGVAILTLIVEWTHIIYFICNGKKVQDCMRVQSFTIRAHVRWRW